LGGTVSTLDSAAFTFRIINQNKKMKISLTAITGNCEKDILRFLDTFQPHFDEVVIVRAIGTAEPDRTLEIAKERGCITGEYLNTKGNDWPHVDDFAAARNYAASLATGDWLAWADIDDLAEGLKFARRILAGLPGTMQIVKCPYILPEQNVDQNFRERFWRNNGKCIWTNALHENLATI
jgi:glycosyltransferase involved in cell wall biosynthesis